MTIKQNSQLKIAFLKKKIPLILKIVLNIEFKFKSNTEVFCGYGKHYHVL